MVGMPDLPDLSVEDKKLVTLARATRARIGAVEGAAARDTDGRTYAAATVDLPSLQISAVQACIAMAVAAGATGIDAIVVLGETGELATLDRAPLRDFAGGEGLVAHLGDPRGSIASTITV